MVNEAVSKLAAYALRTGLIEQSEYFWAVNTILDVLKIDGYTDPGRDWGDIELAPVLEELLDGVAALFELHRITAIHEGLTKYTRGFGKIAFYTL